MAKFVKRKLFYSKKEVLIDFDKIESITLASPVTAEAIDSGDAKDTKELKDAKILDITMDSGDHLIVENVKYNGRYADSITSLIIDMS